MRLGITPSATGLPSGSAIEVLEARIAPATILVTTMADSGDGSLRNAIEQANADAGADVIKFKAKGEILLESPLPAITDSLVLKGKGGTKTIIDGAEAYRVLEIASSVPIDVTISGVILEYGRAVGSGGALAIDNPGGNVLIAKSVIQDCWAVGRDGLGEEARGGGIANENARLVLSKTIIRGNAAEGGSGLDGATGAPGAAGTQGQTGGQAEGGGIFNGYLGTLTITKSTISTNAAQGGTGGAGGMGGPGFGPILAGAGGLGGTGGNAVAGGVHNEGALVVQRSVISGNGAFGGTGGAGGNSGFGGDVPIYIPGGGGDGGDGEGGGLFSARMLVLESSQISGNEAAAGSGGRGGFGGGLSGLPGAKGSSHGGGASLEGSAVVEKTEITANNARRGGGLALADADISFSDSVIAENAAVNGGGIFLSGGTARLSVTSVDSNTAESLGGGITAEGELVIAKSRITGNTAGFGADNYYAVGGGIVLTGNGRITDSVISDNSTFGAGGGVIAGGGDLVIERSIVSSNTAGNEGGGVFNYDGYLGILDSEIRDNEAEGSGGGIFNTGSGVMVIARSIIASNAAGQDGGGVINTVSGDLTIRETTISGNTAAGGGGGVASKERLPSTEPASVRIERSTISGNAAAEGGGILHTGGSFELLASTVAFNEATSAHGGGLSIRAAMEIVASTIARNTADESGGGNWIDPMLDASAAYAENTIIADNTAPVGHDVQGALYARHSLIESLDGASLTGEGNLIGIDPLLGPLKKNGGSTLTMAPKPSSPVVDAGFIYGDVLYDQTGTRRFRGWGFDMGAVEVR